MAHGSQTKFFQLVVKHFPELFGGSVLDVGSLDINGGPHLLISPRTYVGVDLGEGPNVTLVGRGEDLDLPTASFDVSMSSECFEHNPYWRATLLNMVRMTRPEGLIVFTCATTGRLEHGTSRTDVDSAPLAVAVGQEYYENVTPKQVATALRGSSLATWAAFVNKHESDLLFVGIRGPISDSATTLRFNALCNEVPGAFPARRYDGRYARHLAISLFGDRGTRGYQRLGSWRSKLPSAT
jgi:SAM-dependent methyltransferase